VFCFDGCQWLGVAEFGSSRVYGDSLFAVEIDAASFSSESERLGSSCAAQGAHAIRH
jgi:hypothetical protein